MRILKAILLFPIRLVLLPVRLLLLVALSFWGAIGGVVETVTSIPSHKIITALSTARRSQITMRSSLRHLSIRQIYQNFQMAREKSLS